MRTQDRRDRPDGCTCPDDMPASEYDPDCEACVAWVRRFVVRRKVANG